MVRILRTDWNPQSLRRKVLTMKSPSKGTYPDISDIPARKAERRRDSAARSFGEKIEMLEAMRARVEPIRRAREARRKAQAGSRAAKGSELKTS